MDIVAYRRAAVSAFGEMSSWRGLQTHRPFEFENSGFPVRVDSMMDLRPLLDTMQEGGWGGMQKEIGGLSERDVADLVRALRSWRAFAAATFGIRDDGRLPFDTMIVHLVIYRKLCRFKFRDLLEIGPGCGYLSFFLADHPALGRYHQVENTESFYQLQHETNRHCFGARHYERALSDQPATGVATCEHWPWWRMDKLGANSFDLVTSNANLSEMTPEARAEYLALIHRCLTPNGALVAECYGAGRRERVFDDLAKHGFVELPQAGGLSWHVNGVWFRAGERPQQDDAPPATEPRRVYSQAEIAALL